MVQMRSASVVNLALFTTLTSLAASGLQANAYPNFAPPSAVPAGTNVRLNGSSNLGALNQALKSGFEQKYANGKVSISNAGTTASIDAVAAGKADIAAIGRPLTDAEKAKGLVAVPVAREKIAVIVGKNNPYKKDFTINQFAKAFRGEAKSWKDLGGSDKPIRFIDRVSTDTRSAFPNYPAFQGKPLASGANAVKLEDENPAATTEKLGADGVSFLPASMASTQKGVRVLTMHGVDPSDKRYPFSQPLYYVYKGAQPNASVQAFLGYAGSGDGQTKIAQSGVKNPIDFNKDAEAGKVAQVPAVAKADAKPDAKAAVKTDAKTDAKPDAKTAKPADVAKVGAEGKPDDKAAGDKTPVTAANAKPEGSAKPEGAAKPAPQGAVANNQIARGSETGNRIPPWLWWLLLPLGLLGLLLWLLPKDEEDDVLPGRATTGDRRSLTGPSITGPKAGSVVGGAVDAVKGTATNLVDGVGDAANAGGAAVVGIGGAIAGAGAAAAARLRGEGNADRRTDDGEWEPGADANLDLGIETPDWNLNADLPDNDPNRLQGLQDRLGDGLDATKDAFGNVIGAGGGAIAGAGAAAAGLGAAAWSRLRGDATPDDSAASDNLAAADWEFEGGLPENDPSSRMADYVDEASATGGSLRDRAKNMFGNAVDQTRDAAGNVMDGTKDMAGNVMDGTGNAFDRVQSATVDLKDGVGDAAGSTSGWLKSLFGKAKDATGDAANAVGDVGMGLKDGVTGVTGAAIGAAAAGVGAVGATVGNAFGVNQGRVVMVPYNSREALVRWDIAEAVRDQLRDQGGTQLVLRLYDVTDMDATDTLLPTFEQFDVDDTIKEQRILIPQRDRTYMTILGYLTRSGGFLEVSRSESVQIPTA
jgi:phosphate transport system substrate-binding protein